MRLSFLVPPSLLLLAACAPLVGEPGIEQVVESAPVGTPRIATLAGEWRVAGIDGADFNEPYGLALRGSAQELWWEPRCARMARSYRIDGTAIRFDAPLDRPKSGDPPPMVCLIAPPARLADVMRALDAATTVGRTPQNGVLISGGGRSLLLFAQ